MRNRSGKDFQIAEPKTLAVQVSPLEPLTKEPPTSPPAAYQPPTHATAADTTTYQVHVKIFVLSTGDDSGGNCELTGWISFPGTGAVSNFTVDLLVKRSFAAENKGLGRLIAEFSGLKVSQPNPFQAFVSEDDWGGFDHILGHVMDWTRPENEGFADGREWWWKWSNTEDNRYQCHLWWQVWPPWQ